MATTTSAIAKLIAEARERSEDVLKLTPNITIDDVFLWQVAQTLEAVTTDRNNAARRIDELQQRASDWLTRANNNYDALKSQLKAVTRERDEKQEEINAVKKVAEDFDELYHEEQERADAVTKERDALREALEFYATAPRWHVWGEDKGAKARAALASRATPQEK